MFQENFQQQGSPPSLGLALCVVTADFRKVAGTDHTQGPSGTLHAEGGPAFLQVENPLADLVVGYPVSGLYHSSEFQGLSEVHQGSADCYLSPGFTAQVESCDLRSKFVPMEGSSMLQEVSVM